MSKSLSVLIPVVNATDELRGVHEETVAELERLGIDFEVFYLVSTPVADVLGVVQSLQEKDPERIRVLQFGNMAGQSAMLSAGFEEAEGAILLTLPSAYEVEPNAIGKLIAAVEAGADLAFAPRVPRDAGSRRLQSRAFNRIVSWAAGTEFSDITTDTRAIRRRVLEEIPLYGDFHRYLPVLADRSGFNVKEVPEQEHSKSTAQGTYAVPMYLWRAMDILSIFFLSRFTRRPLRLFGGIGSLFAGVGGVILLVVTFERLFLGEAMADRPILVLSALLFGLGVQTFTIGLLGELILFFHARTIRDYRVTAIYEADEAALPPRPVQEEPRS